MNVILGASGQVGSAIAKYLIKNKREVRAVIRDPKKADDLERHGIEVRIANYFDLEALKDVIQGGDLIFVLTPESPKSEDVLGDTQTLLNNYRKAISSSGIHKIVGLSSIGAQHESGTGNLLMSHMLENAFTEIAVPQVYVRPAYYYSNWLPYLSVVKEQGMLPTFFPVDQKIPMNAPTDVAEFIAAHIISGIEKSAVHELVGPENLSSKEVASMFSQVLDRSVEAQQIPRERWVETLLQSGFTNDAAENLIAMTEAVIEEKAKPEGKGSGPVQLKTSLKQYLTENIS